MLGGVESNDEKMPSVWFSTGEQLTAKNYEHILDPEVFAWVKKITEKSYYVFRQEGAYVHTAKIAYE